MMNAIDKRKQHFIRAAYALDALCSTQLSGTGATTTLLRLFSPSLRPKLLLLPDGSHPIVRRSVQGQVVRRLQFRNPHIQPGQSPVVCTSTASQAVPVFASASTASHVVWNVTKKSVTLVISMIFFTRGFTPVNTRHLPVF